MTPEQMAMIDEIPAYFRSEKLETEAVYFREPGGMGFGLETVAVFLLGSIALGVTYDVIKAAATAAIDWARDRVRRHQQDLRADDSGSSGRDSDDSADPPVRVTIYGPNGAMLRAIEVSRSGVDDPFGQHFDTDRR
ncbi:hypothetical protein [Gordonia sp. NPDC058843]|uniref:hypothetical protein n=1 Tax=Gordonia sp. NPDC058843 TaxID=3346648 RepID=UPI0036BCF75D